VSGLPPPPRRNADLIGHAAAASAIQTAFARGRPHHAWLLAGPPGLGKATLAFRAARWILAGATPTDPPLSLDAAHPVFRRVAAGSHADLRVLEREYDPKRRKVRSELVVEQVRDLARFLRMTAGEGAYRVVIVDPADEMNRNAANALLKLLEEPPPGAMLFLVSHAPGGLLPTIRSRCRLLRLAPPEATATEAWLARLRPGVPAEAIRRALALAGGAPGAALARLDMEGGDGFDAQAAVWQVLGALPRGDRAAGQALAQRLGRAGAEDEFFDFFAAFDATLARLCAAMAGHAPATLPAEEAALARQLLKQRPLGDWAAAWEKAREAARLADTYNLDRRAVAWLTIAALRPGERAYTPAAWPPAPAP
jgi:DNA polymerase-3 subunit delta'